MLPSTTSPMAIPISLAVWAREAAEPARSCGAWEMTSFIRNGNAAPTPAVASTAPQTTARIPDRPAGISAYDRKPTAIISRPPRTTRDGGMWRPSHGPRFDATIIAIVDGTSHSAARSGDSSCADCR